MDKLKETAYWISLGAAVIVLLGLVWYLVLARIFLSSGATVATQKEKLEQSLKAIQGYNESEFVPTEKYESHLKDTLDLFRLDHNDGARYYNTRQERFGQFFGGETEAPSSGLFASTLEESIEAIVENYRQKFNITEGDEEGDENGRDKDDAVRIPTVSHIDSAEISDLNVPIAMKEYWITDGIFKALEKLEIGGLKSIGFPGRNLTGRDAADDEGPYRLIDVEATIHMPLSQLEDLITELFRDERALFLLDGFEAQKTFQQLNPYLALTQTAEFDNRDLADQARYADIVKEPDVKILLKLKALDWNGVAEIPRALYDEGDDLADDGDGADDAGTVNAQEKKRPR